MAETPSTMLPLGTPLPDFSLPNVIDGTTLSSWNLRGAEALLVVFTANHCPFAQHTLPGILDLARQYTERGLKVVAISSNDVDAYPQDGPEEMRELAQKQSYPFPYLFDTTQGVAKAFTAACTPDLFLFDRQQKLVYRGQFDDSRPGNGKPLTGDSLRGALDQVLAGQPVNPDQKPSVGCNIKWRAGNEPEYFHQHS